MRQKPVHYILGKNLKNYDLFVMSFVDIYQWLKLLNYFLHIFLTLLKKLLKKLRNYLKNLTLISLTWNLRSEIFEKFDLRTQMRIFQKFDSRSSLRSQCQSQNWNFLRVYFNIWNVKNLPNLIIEIWM
jgi:hypothetical protein